MKLQFNFICKFVQNIKAFGQKMEGYFEKPNVVATFLKLNIYFLIPKQDFLSKSNNK